MQREARGESATSRPGTPPRYMRFAYMSDRCGNLVGAMAIALCDHVDRTVERVIPERLPAAALVHVSHCDRPSILSLAKVLRLSHSATVRLVDRMVDLNLVERTPAAWDSRAVALRLTAKGCGIVDQILAGREAALVEVLSRHLNAADRDALADIASRLLAALTIGGPDLDRICRLCDFASCADCPVAESAG